MNEFKPTPCEDFPGWYEIPGFAQYAANRKGEVLTKKTGNATQGGIAGRYRKVKVYPNGSKEPEMRYTHELICRAFHGAPKTGQVVLHRRDDRLDNRPSQLRWGTQSENIQSAWDNGLIGTTESFPPSSRW